MISEKGRVLSLNYGSPNIQKSRKEFNHSAMKLMSNSGFGCGGAGHIKLTKDRIETIHTIEDLINISLENKKNLKN